MWREKSDARSIIAKQIKTDQKPSSSQLLTFSWHEKWRRFHHGVHGQISDLICWNQWNFKVPPVLEEEGHRYFGNLPLSMLSLFMSIAGGVSWEEVLKPLLHVSSLWALCFIFYICFLASWSRVRLFNFCCFHLCLIYTATTRQE